MGYESKIIVVERTEHQLPNGEPWVFGSEIARFDLSKMGYESVSGKMFREIFETPIDFNLYNVRYIDENEPNLDPEEFRTDCYGEHCKYASLDEVLSWLSKSETSKEYRRAKLFFAFLQNLKNSEASFSEIAIVHFGY